MKRPASVLPKTLRRTGKRPLRRVEVVAAPRRARLSKRLMAFIQRTYAERDRRLARQARKRAVA